MRITELDYDYPPELVAHHPVSPRDVAKLMVYNRSLGTTDHRNFFDLPKMLKSGDVLVLNQTKVFPARSYATTTAGRRVEVLFLDEVGPKKWEVLIGGRVADGEEISFNNHFLATVEKGEKGTFLKVSVLRSEVLGYLEVSGHVPLPPYIKREDEPGDREEYQTVFAAKVGSAAAPTAGLHFTEELLKKLKEQGIEIEYVTLHVGLGTFAPVKTETVEDHPIHTEQFEISERVARKLNQAKKEKRRIIACGTTVVRVLESAISESGFKAQRGETALFIYPGYQFRAVDGMITNFHTPRSSLLALVYAFAGQEKVRELYYTAIEKRYRLFSYGDGMLLL